MNHPFVDPNMQIHNAIRLLKEACALKHLAFNTEKSYTHLPRRQRLLLKPNQNKLESLADQARGEPDHDSRHRCPGVQASRIWCGRNDGAAARQPWR